MKILSLTIGRTGHSAINTWLSSQFTETACIWNDALLENGVLLPNKVIGTSNKNIIYSKERFNVDDFETLCATNNYDYKILILRDSYNMIASMYKFVSDNLKESHITKSYCFRNEISPSTVDLWKSHVKEALGYSNKMKGVIYINYNLWCKDIIYRKSISDKLGVSFNDDNFRTPSTNGGGSSFNGGDTSKRYLHYTDDNNYIALFDDEMIELNKKYFEIDYPFNK
jgi:hypothetical protein